MKELSRQFSLGTPDLKKLAKLIGSQPPCKNCIVKVTCFRSYFNDILDTIIDLEEPCEDAIDWFQKAKIIDNEIRHLLCKKDDSLLSSEDIIEIIKFWNYPGYFLEKETGIPFSTIIRIGSYINKLDNRFCRTDIIDDEIKILKDRIEEALKYFRK